MKFIHPEMFLLVPVLLTAVLLAALAAGRKRKKLLLLLLGAAAADPRAVRVSYARRRWRIVFLLLSMFSLVTAAARPYWNTRLLPFEATGRDVMVLFDVSKSMYASDPAPSRLEHAKFLLRQLVADRAGDRFGLVAFAGNAFLACPLTSDPLAFEQYVSELSPEMVPLGGTNLELALATAQKAFQAASGSNRAIVLFSDGDELSGNAARQLAQLKQRRIPLIAVGLGNPAIATPVPDGKAMKRDAAGNVVTSKLNEPMLRRLAESSGGIYVRSTATEPGLKAIEARLEQLENSTKKQTKRSVPEERFPVPLAAAAFFFTVSLLLTEKSSRAGLAALLLCGAFCLTGAAPQEKAQRDEEKLPESPEMLYNTARTRQQKGDPSAENLYEEVMKKAPDRPDLQSRSLQNLGVSLHTRARGEMQQATEEVRQQKLDEALQKLSAAGKSLKNAEELYVQSLSLPEAELQSAAVNLQQLEQDKKHVEDLKKKIEELKKQQEKAQRQAKQAQQQNKQQQNQQQQNQQQQNQQQQNQQQQNQQQQNQQQKKNRQTPEEEAEKARQEAEKLARQAEQLQQQKLKEQAERAAKELQKARQEQKKQNPEQAQKHLDEAVKALGAPEDPNRKQDRKPQEKNPSRPEPQGQRAPQKNQPAPTAGEQKKSPGSKSGEQLLKLLQDEENRRRGDLRIHAPRRRTEVEKDW